MHQDNIAMKWLDHNVRKTGHLNEVMRRKNDRNRV